MFGSTSLQTPKSGRSRFSKALPAPPSFPPEDNGSSLTAASHPSHPTYGNSAPTYTPTYTYTQAQAQAQAQAHTQPQTQMSSPVRQLPASPTGLPFLKELPPIDLGPPLPPPKAFEDGILDKEGAMAAVKPLNSPLPPLPHKSGPVAPPMSIPRRRPVGATAQAQQPQTPTVTLAPSPAPVWVPAPIPSPVPILAAAPSLAPSAAPDTAPEIISPNPLPSPVTSLSSLLSAYTDHTSESTPRTSTNSTNGSPATKNPHSESSPKPGESRGTDSPTLPPAPEAQLAIKDENSLPPPPPVKDSQPDLQKPQFQQGVGHQDVSPVVDTHQTEQLWRRRSVKSDKNIAVPELKLTSSNGSTVASGHISANILSQGTSSGIGGANSVPLSSQTHDQTASSIPSTVRKPLPRSSNAGLPGKNIRPIVSRQQFKDEENMGQSASNSNGHGLRAWAKEMLGKEDGKGELGPQNQHTHTTAVPSKALASPNAPQIVTRLPTPDYENNEARTALSNTVVSPVSPASSPELPLDSISVISPTSPPNAVHDIHPAVENKPGPSSLNTPRPPVGLPSSPAAGRSQNRSAAQNFPARTSSKTKAPSKDIKAWEPEMDIPASLRVGNQQKLPSPANNPVQQSPVSQARSAEAEKPPNPLSETPELGLSLDGSLPGQQATEGESDENMTDHPGAALFPRDWCSPLPADGVMDALPLADRHYRCITNHRYMTANRQRYNPIACATCGHRDRISDAYICSACHLNICANCSANLRRCKGDLRQLIEQIKEMNNSVEEDDRAATITQANSGVQGEQIGAA